jgi:hypothetical protein
MRVAFDLSHPYRSTVTVNWRTVNAPGQPGVASSGSDYTAASGRLVYPKGATRQFAEVLIVGDTRVEADEHVLIDLSNPVSATLGAHRGFGIIDDDD